MRSVLRPVRGVPGVLAMPVALWRTGLLLSFLRACASSENRSCVLGIVGRPVSLPCFYADASGFVNLTIEWRREDVAVLRSAWDDEGNVEMWSKNSVAVPADAPVTGNFSLELPSVHPREDNIYYSMYFLSPDNQSIQLCSSCLSIAARFSYPSLQREAAAPGEDTVFLCHSGGGFPEPAVSWVINNTEKPPEGSVKTLTTWLPDSQLYNISSNLTLNVSSDSSVSCIIKNVNMNESWTSTSYGVHVSQPVGRASEAMWMFSTALCVVVGVMVAVGVAYQIHLDRSSRKKKKRYQHQHQERGYRRKNPLKEETEAMKLQSGESGV